MKKFTLVVAAMSVFEATLSFFTGNWSAGLGWTVAALYQYLTYISYDKIFE